MLKIIIMSLIIRISLGLLVFILVVKVVPLMHVILELLVYLVEIMYGLRKELTQEDPKKIEYLEIIFNSILRCTWRLYARI